MTRIVSSPPIVPAISDRRARSIAIASGCACPGSVRSTRSCSIGLLRAEVLFDRSPECGLPAGAWNVSARAPIRAIDGPLDQSELADVSGQSGLGRFDVALTKFFAELFLAA